MYVCTTSNQNLGGGLQTRLLVPCVDIFRMNCSLKLKLKTATRAIVYMALEMFYKMLAHHGMFERVKLFI